MKKLREYKSLLFLVALFFVTLSVSTGKVQAATREGNIEWEITDEKLVVNAVSGTNGKMKDYVEYYNDPGWKYETITKLEIGEGVTYIGNNAFSSMHELTHVTIPSTVTNIGDEAFAYAGNYDITIRFNMKKAPEIGYDAFYCVGVYKNAIFEVMNPDVKIQLSSNVGSSCYADYKIVGKTDISKITFTGIENKKYTGNAIKQKLVIKHRSYTLKENKDYTVKYSNNVKVGTATVEITGKGYYNGTVKKTFKITPGINKTKLSLYKGSTSTLKLSGTSSKVTWKSSKTSIATVSASGVVTAKKAGETKITGTVNGLSVSCTVTVKNPSIDKKLTIYVGNTKTLKVTGGSGTIKWSSSNKKAATVSSKGVVTAKQKGTTTITAKRNGVTMTCKVTVKNVSLNKTSASIYTTEKVTLSLNGASSGVKWTTSKSSIATVSSKGVVTGKGKGTAKITATYKGKKYVCTVTVKSKDELFEKYAAYGINMLYEILKDPNSLEVISVKYGNCTDYEGGREVVEIDYTAKNSYGGRVRGYVNIFPSNTRSDFHYSIVYGSKYLLFDTYDYRGGFSSSKYLDVDRVLSKSNSLPAFEYYYPYY